MLAQVDWLYSFCDFCYGYLGDANEVKVTMVFYATREVSQSSDQLMSKCDRVFAKLRSPKNSDETVRMVDDVVE